MRSEAAKPMLRKRGDQRAAIGEVALGRRVGDAHPPRHFAQGERGNAALLDQLEGGVDQRLAQIPVVVGLLPGHELLSSTIMLTVETWLASNVVGVNIGAARSLS